MFAGSSRVRNTKFVATGGQTTTFNGHKIHLFTGTDTFVVSKGRKKVDLFMVAMGGWGGSYYKGGGGGAGGILITSKTLITGNYAVVFNVAGATRGGDVVFSDLTAVGGGHGGTNSSNGNAGGSGGGGGQNAGRSGGAGTSGQGNSGGRSAATTLPGYGGGGGGGGFSQVGFDPPGILGGAKGGDGLVVTTLFGFSLAQWVSIFGNFSINFGHNNTGAFGGGGGGDGGLGGIGGGGNGDGGNPDGFRIAPSGVAYTGGGGGGSGWYTGGAGGSGLIIVKYRIY